VSVILVRPKEIACGELREALEQYDRDPKATGQLCVVVCPQLEPIGPWTLDGPRWSKVLVLHQSNPNPNLTLTLTLTLTLALALALPLLLP
jgi:hypothetical protein